MKTQIYYIVLILLVFQLSCNTTDDNIQKVEPKAKMMKEDVVFTTSDNIKIHGTYYYNNIEVTKKEPLIILIHQFMSDRSQWKMDFIDSLLARKCKVITYDIRNHGESDKAVEKIEEILSEKGNAILDLASVINWAKGRIGIDSTRIAVVGTSVGASLGLYSKYFLGVKTVVGISLGKKTFDAFISGTDLSMGPAIKKTNSVLLICGDKDSSYPEDAKEIYTNYLDEPKELKYYNSDKHGKDLINQIPEINKIIIDWLNKNL